MRAIRNLFKPTPIRSLLEDALYEARRLEAQHQLEASRSQALADMYSHRVGWLTDKIATLPDNA